MTCARWLRYRHPTAPMARNAKVDKVADLE